ncbi:N-acetylglucosamine-6-phosphate deacetylase [Lysobacter brunescens]|uniref:N-acetylglucosamine-6-phosphate deacetylase n=1 Tax=Lysobacter brunescens TaxID=262323 RepID=A0ABW2Y912_9GAMM
MSRIALVNARVLAGESLREGLAVVIEDGRITMVCDETALPPDCELRDLGGKTLLPGFIDVQVNGGGGVLFNNASTVDALRRIAEAHRRFGTTGLLPTLISDDVAVMRAAIAAVREAIEIGVPGILGLHLEGPYLAAARKGTHDAGKFRVPDEEEVALASSLDNGVTMLTLAPDCVPDATLRAFAARGVVLCAGHTAATYEQTRAGLDAGVRGFTHLYNAMTPIQGRAPGVVGAALEDRDSWCGIIVDGHHVHPASLRVALAAKPRGKLVLVTDAMPPVGADDPSYVLYGDTISVRDGVLRNAEGALAGSVLDMASAVRNTVKWLDVPLEEAARMASTYAAEWIDLGDRHGRIAPGYRADLVLLDEELQVVETWIDGASIRHGG